LKVVLRIGPFCHGEIRNGGLPDWLFGRPFNVRSNDPEYLTYVDKLYQEIGKQLQGLYFKDGGPIFAIQLENEYQHSASPWGLTYPGQPVDWTAAERDKEVTKGGVDIADTKNPYAQFGNEHMRILKSLAQKAGLDVPIYTATGWGNAAVIENESLPVTAAYPYPSWAVNSQQSTLYLFADLQKKPDYSPVRYKPEDYPCFAAEIGGGIPVNYSRRPVVPAKSLDALITRFLGSGANGLGYYMYHGGSTPRGKQYFFADEAYAYPKINYDFQAPLGEYGQIRPSFHRLKLIHFFLNSFGDKLAPMQLILPATNEKIKPQDTTELRYSVRTKDGSGFVFLNNFQDHIKNKDITDVQIKVKTAKGDILIPEASNFTLKSQENAIIPFNFDLGGTNLIYATAQLLTKGGSDKEPFYVFFAPEGINPEFSIAKTSDVKVQGKKCKIESNNQRWMVKCSGVSEFEIVKKNGATVRVLVVDKDFALKSWLVSIQGKPGILFSDALVLENTNSCEFYSMGKNSFEVFVYPKVNTKPQITAGTITNNSKTNPIMSELTVNLTEQKMDIKTARIGNNKLLFTLPASLPEGLNDAFIKINYVGDTGMGLMNGELVADNFYYGDVWEIGLKKFMDLPKHDQMNFYFRPIYKDAPYLADISPEKIPNFNKTKSVLNIQSIDIEPEYQVSVKF
jgi:hypothetical protein